MNKKDICIVILVIVGIITISSLLVYLLISLQPSQEKLNAACGSDEYISYIYNSKKYYVYCRQIETNQLLIKKVK
jgi:hypothetical protein